MVSPGNLFRAGLPMICRRTLLFCSAISAAVLLAPCCAPQATPPSQQSAAPTPSAPPVIRTNANLVLVDVVVTEKGKPIQGLTASQFHILENGREQRISIFEEHRATDAQQSAPLPPLPPQTYSNYPRFALTSAANVVLLDALNTPIPDQSYVRQQMMQYVKHIPPGTRIAVFTLASRLRMIEGFTTDASAVAAAVAKASPEQSAILDSENDQTDINNTATSMSSIDNNALQQFAADTESHRLDLRVDMTLDALSQLGRYLSTIPGRKNLVWFSGTFPLQIDPDPSQSPTLTPNANLSQLDPFSPMRDYSEQVKQADALLTAARIAVYPVDARGLMNLSSVDASRDFTSPTGVPGGHSTRNTPNFAAKADSKFTQQTVSEHQTMQQIAQETGGAAFFDTNGLGEAVAKSIANGANYFTIGYVPDLRTKDGLFRSVQVHVDGAKYELAYRRGYYAVDPAKPGPDAPGIVAPVVAALQRGAPPISQVVFEARVLSAADPAAREVKVFAGPAGAMAQSLKSAPHRYLVDFSADPHGITWIPGPNGIAHGEVEVAMVAWGADGQRINYTDHAFSVNLDPAKATLVLRSGLPLHQEIDLPAGDLYLRVAIHDLPSGHIGSMEIPLRVMKP
jgi:VWFA-related protein